MISRSKFLSVFASEPAVASASFRRESAVKAANTHIIDLCFHSCYEAAAMNSDSVLSVLSVGAGWVVNNRHLPSLRLHPGFRLAGIIAHDEKKGRATADRFKAPFLGAKLDFNQPEQTAADVVIIGTDPKAHGELIRESLLAGKHVLVEKPMTLSPEECAELADLAKRQGRVLAVVHNFQFSRAAHAYRRDVQKGKIGAIRAVYGVQLCNHARNIPRWCHELPLGLFFDESPHFYYLFRWLAGLALQLVHATVWRGGSHGNTPRMVTAEYSANGAFPVYLHINFDSSLTEWHVTVVGDKGTAILDVWRDIYTYLPNDGVHTAKDITRTGVLAVVQHLWGVFTGGLRYITGRHLYGNVEVQDRFYRAIQGEDTLQGMSANDGMAVVALQRELIEKARYIG